MANAGFFRGTSLDQDSRFSNKEKKLMKQLTYDPVLEEKVRLPPSCRFTISCTNFKRKIKLNFLSHPLLLL